MIRMIEQGSERRTSGPKFANAHLSRSHAILQIILRQNKMLHVKFSLVDLAGDERATDERIQSLGQNREHIPFQTSKLTEVL
ncbi:kinesin-like protein KIF2C [Tachysurus fulvidraco]|uniref:kinesin-like protein KIF2C n=1 Tax=Tachysurus fulvidraco TaxID=1234273 RepID=UPI001FEE746D|nr:kinesin-like protein KIF2C [Tachysurus fulvidraco]